jgi:D-glycero-beta-D-manno-heptose 1-phosphate adenylyltransferase
MQNKLQLIESKIYELSALSRIVNQWHMMSKKVVFTNGVFDIVHKGHNTYLLQAAELGNRLIVGVNSDSSTKRLKGEQRPIMDQYSRAFNLASHTYVDAVILFEEDTPMNLITTLKPDILAKGGDYTIETVVGANEVIAYGGTIEIIPFLDGYSTTNVIKVINNVE